MNDKKDKDNWVTFRSPPATEKPKWFMAGSANDSMTQLRYFLWAHQDVIDMIRLTSSAFEGTHLLVRYKGETLSFVDPDPAVVLKLVREKLGYTPDGEDGQPPISGNTCTVSLQVRISDNVLEERDWTVGLIELSYDVEARGWFVESVWARHTGVYAINVEVGWSLEQLADWLMYDPAGSHPETYHEFYDRGEYVAPLKNYEQLEKIVSERTPRI